MSNESKLTSVAAVPLGATALLDRTQETKRIAGGVELPVKPKISQISPSFLVNQPQRNRVEADRDEQESHCQITTDAESSHASESR